MRKGKEGGDEFSFVLSFCPHLTRPTSSYTRAVLVPVPTHRRGGREREKKGRRMSEGERRSHFCPAAVPRYSSLSLLVGLKELRTIPWDRQYLSESNQYNESASEYLRSSTRLKERLALWRFKILELTKCISKKGDTQPITNRYSLERPNQGNESPWRCVAAGKYIDL
jgi:hypothetical protein